MFADPPFYGVVRASPSAHSVTIRFGPHHALLHGSEDREFSEADALKYNLIVVVAPAWMKDHDDLFRYNGLLAMRYAGSAEMGERGWLNRADGTSYKKHFAAVDPVHGERFAALWLCHFALKRMQAWPQHAPLGGDADPSVVKERLRATLAHASSIVPEHARRGDDVDEDSDDEDQEGADEPIECVGYPEGWTFGWSACKTVKASKTVRDAFRKTWWLFQATQEEGEKRCVGAVGLSF